MNDVVHSDNLNVAFCCFHFLIYFVNQNQHILVKSDEGEIALFALIKSVELENFGTAFESSMENSTKS